MGGKITWLYKSSLVNNGLFRVDQFYFPFSELLTEIDKESNLKNEITLNLSIMDIKLFETHNTCKTLIWVQE